MSIITTLENQCRALASAQSPDENASRFLVGTQSLNSDNLLYLFEYKDDNNNLAKVSFKFPYGELWHLATTSKHSNLVTGVVSRNPGHLEVSLFKLPQEIENSIEDDYGLSESPIEKVFELTTTETNHKNLTRQCHWHPDNGDRLLICNDGFLEFYDVERQQKSSSFSYLKTLESQSKSQLPTKDIESNDKNEIQNKSVSSRVTDLRWSSLFNCSVVAAAIGPRIFGIDTRIPDTSSSSICWLIEDERCNQIKSIDFNPNSQYYLASGGDDCRAKFWDLRQTLGPVLHIESHTHWIWSIRYNPFHDQLVLSAGSDARVALMRANSIASEPFGQIMDCDESDTGEADDSEDERKVGRDDTELSEDDERSKTLAQQQMEQQPVDRIDYNDYKERFEVSDGNLVKVSVSNERLAAKCTSKEQLRDEVINIYEEHDDSVYAAEWATDPWIFASLGYESRLVINKVPKKEKFNILF